MRQAGNQPREDDEGNGEAKFYVCLKNYESKKYLIGFESVRIENENARVRLGTVTYILEER
jgi:hypothetical protein